MSYHSSRPAEKISIRLERFLGENVYLLILAAVIGVLGGFGAVLFRELIDIIRTTAFAGGSSTDALAQTPWYWIVLPPAAGGLVVGPLIYFFAREAKGHGIPEVMNAVSNRGGKIRKRVMTVKTIASAITIGSGGSVGREGPIVQIGAGVGSAIGQLLGFDGNKLIILLGCGAAAGMAATFNAPIAGVILAVEVIIGSATISVFSPLVVASVSGTVVTRLIYGDETFIEVPDYTLLNPALELPLYLALGVAAGVTAMLFTRGIVLFEDLWDKAKIPQWLSPAIGGAMVGGVALFFPQVLGVGYETVFKAVHGQEVLWVLVALIFLKIFAAGTSLGSGGSGGVFAPSLFVGACLGGAFGLVVEQVFPGQTAHSGAYALVGMGAVLAGTTHAPITAILMLFEITTTYTIILPLMFSCIISLVLSTKLFSTSIFTTRLKRRGVRLRSSAESELMRSTKVRRLLRPFPETMLPVTPASKVVEGALLSPMGHQYVVDSNNKLLGEISLNRIKNILREQSLDDALMLAVDMMDSEVTAVRLDDTLDMAMGHISRQDTEMLPVVDENDQLMGSITRHDIMVFFEHEILRNEAATMKFLPESSKEDFSLVELPKGETIAEILVGDSLNGETLKTLDMRATFGLNVIGIQRKSSSGIVRLSPEPHIPFQVGDQLSVVGQSDAIDVFKQKFQL
ncbi:MAG: chloride channel protein [Deltaproteobacteria bacterium]|nr:chloride channel protein [Deltaproteobacteria bacterium]MBN2672411.1 chloride channel protein [Deltaproteobacteria bacterium]